MFETPPPVGQSRARHLGRRSGYVPLSQGADCPFPHDQIVLRQQWFTGFGEGRELYRLDNQSGHARIK